MKNDNFIAKYLLGANCRNLSLERAPSTNLKMIVVIPCFNETKIIRALNSICDIKNLEAQFEVIIVINHPKSADQEIKKQAEKCLLEIESWRIENKEWCNAIFPVLEILEDKHAGVGLARKIGMDTAAFRFCQIDNPNGIILNYDADCTCETGYLDEIKSYFDNNIEIDAASIYYEHPYHLLKDKKHRSAIIDYELHLRIYILWKNYIGLPYAIHTVGSAMAVRAGIYTRKGGMNKRKAGEDFYFIHKFSLDNYGEINTTRIYPSCRTSDRVPFGTGRAMKECLEDGSILDSYHPESFLVFKELLSDLSKYFKNSQYYNNYHPGLNDFLSVNNFSDKIREIHKNTGSYSAFVKRFFQWMNAFLFMKYLHHMRDIHFPNISALDSTIVYLEHTKKTIPKNNETALEQLRDIQKSM